MRYSFFDKDTTPVWLYWLGRVVILNATVYGLASVTIGGFPLKSSGPIAGHRYVGNHGKYFEVSDSVYAYSVVHERITVVGLLILVVTLIAYWIVRVFLRSQTHKASVK